MPRPGQRLAFDLARAAVCGAATALCLPRPGLCFLGWFSLAGLFALWNRSDFRRSFLIGLAAGFGFNGLSFYWIYNTCRFAGVAVPVAVLAWFSLALFLALHWALIGLAGSRLPARFRPWGWAVLWTAASVIWERWTPRPSGDLLAYTQYRSLPLIQMGAIFGPHGLGFLVVLFNAALAELWKRREGAKAEMVLAAVLPAFAWIWGESHLLRRPQAAVGARVEILQPNIDQYAKWSDSSAKAIDANFAELLALPRTEPPAIIVWPESALPRLIDEETAHLPGRKAFQAVGAVTRRGAKTFNSLLWLDGGGKIQGVYHKRELVPFGEYIPFNWMKRFIGILNELGGIDAGDAAQPLWGTPLGTAAATICYEAVFPRWPRRDAARGARLIFNVTNDGWYKDTWGPYQHFYTNVFRAVENRVTVLRSGNTGISAVIDPWGVVTARLDLNTCGRLDASVPYDDPFPERSFYTRHGDWFGILCLIAALPLLL